MSPLARRLREDQVSAEFSELYGGTFFRSEGAGPLVILGHGLGHDSSLWDPVAEALRAHARVVRFDLLGHGRSAKPPGPYNLGSFLRQFEVIERRLPREPLHLVGHAAGALLALRRALESPERIASATLLHPFARPPLEGVSPMGPPHALEAVARMRQRCDPVILQTSGKIFEEFWRELSSRDILLDCPVKLVVGASDPNYSGPSGHDLGQRIRGARTHPLARVGVLSPLVDSEEIATLVLGQLTDAG